MVRPCLGSNRHNQADHHQAAQRSTSHSLLLLSHGNAHHADLLHHGRHEQRRCDGRHNCTSRSFPPPTDRREGHSVDGAEVLGSEAQVGIGREHGEGAANAEVEHTHPEHKTPLAVLGREGEGRQEGCEDGEHETHRLLVAQLVVLRLSSSRLPYHPAPEGAADAVADGRDGGDQSEEEIVVNNHLTEKLGIMNLSQNHLEEGRNENVRDGHEHDGEPELPERALLHRVLGAHAFFLGLGYSSGEKRVPTVIEEILGLGSHFLHLFLGRFRDHQQSDELKSEIARSHHEEHLRHSGAYFQREELFL